MTALRQKSYKCLAALKFVAVSRSGALFIVVLALATVQSGAVPMARSELHACVLVHTMLIFFLSGNRAVCALMRLREILITEACVRNLCALDEHSACKVLNRNCYIYAVA